MRQRRRYVEMAERCGVIEFRLYGMEGGVMVEVLAHFKYLGLSLDQTEDDWSTVPQNVKWAQRV